MASNFETVRPGDVITADLINRIIRKLQELEDKVGSGGTTNQPVITSLDPETEQVVGGQLTINGNFDTPLNANTVRVGETIIPATNFLPGSSGTRIIFQIPTSFEVPAGSRLPVTVSVQTSTKGTGSRNYQLAPQPQTGVPNPQPDEIRSTVNTSLGANQVETTRGARITGLNLAPNPTVNFVTTVNGAQVRTPATVTSATSSQINLTVPSVPGANQFNIITATVEVVIPGAGQAGTIPIVTVLTP